MELDSHGVPRWPFIVMALIGLAAAGALLMVLGSGWQDETGPDDTVAPGPGEPLLDGSSVARLMDARTRLDEIRRLGRTRTVEAVPMLRKFTQDPDPQVRLAAVRALGEVGDPGAMQALRVRAFDDDPRVRVETARAFGKLYGPEADEGLRDILGTDDASVRAEAVNVLAALAEDEAHRDRAVATLLEALDDESADVRRRVVQALSAVPGEAAIRALASSLGDPDAVVRSAAAEAYAQAKTRMAPHLAAALAETASLAARLDAARLLGRGGAAESVPTLLRLLEDLGRRPGPGVEALEAAVVEALVSIGEPAVAPLVEETIDGECEPRAEKAAAAACIRIGRPAARPISEALLRWKLFPDAQELQRWVDALGEIGDPAASAALDRALAQGIDGMDEHVSEARRKIAAKSGADLPPPAPDAGLLAEPAGPPDTEALVAEPVFFTPANPGAEAIPDDGVVRLTLEGALLRGSGRHDLEVELERRGGSWSDRLFGYSPRFNKRSHDGRLTHHEADAESLALDITMIVHDDLFVKGGVGTYSVELKKGGAAWAGRYAGQFNFQDVGGEVRVVVYRRPWPKRDGIGFEVGEHPRLLFRRRDVPRIRERTRTALGRRVVSELRRRLAAHKTLYRERVNWVTTWQPGMDAAIGHGFLATVFDDAPHGRRAAALMMERTTTPPYGGEHGERFPGPVFLFPIAYDLGYGHLGADERDTIGDLLASFYDRFGPDVGPRGIFAVNRGVFAVPGLMALAVLRDQGPFEMGPPAEPPPVMTIGPPDGFKPGVGVPVNPLRQGEMVRDWLAAGPFEAAAQGPEEADPLAALGGPARARPEVGTTVDWNGASFPFEPLPETAVGQIGGTAVRTEYLSFPAADAASRTYLYSVLALDRAGGFIARRRHPMVARWSRIWISGREVPDGTAVVLGPGLHPVMVEVRGTVACPAPGEGDAFLARAEAIRYEWAMDRFRDARRRHDETGERQDVRLVFEMCRRGYRTSARQQLERAVSSGEVRANGDGLGFVSACWRATGEPLVPDTPFVPAVRPEAIRSGALGPRYLIFAMGLAPESLRPEIAAEFDRRYPLDESDVPARKRTWRRLSCLDLVALLVNYPLDVKSGI